MILNLMLTFASANAVLATAFKILGADLNPNSSVVS